MKVRRKKSSCALQWRTIPVYSGSKMLLHCGQDIPISAPTPVPVTNVRSAYMIVSVARCLWVPRYRPQRDPQGPCFPWLVDAPKGEVVRSPPAAFSFPWSRMSQTTPISTAEWLEKWEGGGHRTSSRVRTTDLSLREEFTGRFATLCLGQGGKENRIINIAVEFFI